MADASLTTPDNRQTSAATECAAAALVALAEHGVPTDVQELLVYGNPRLGVKPNALGVAIAAAARSALSRAKGERT